MRLELGKFYRTRDGAVVGPVVSSRGWLDDISPAGTDRRSHPYAVLDIEGEEVTFFYTYAGRLFAGQSNDGDITQEAAPFEVNKELRRREALLRERETPPITGRKDDAGKARLDLIAPEMLFALGEILGPGAIKYEERNWEKGMKWGRPFGAMMRHMWAWWGGKLPTKTSFLFGELDVETGKSHLWHAACCLMFLIAYEIRGTGEDDRAK